MPAVIAPAMSPNTLSAKFLTLSLSIVSSLRHQAGRRIVRCRSTARKLHQGERSAAVRAVRIAERFRHFEVRVVRRFQKRALLALSPDGRGEVAALALQLRRVEAAAPYHDRCIDPV